MRLDKFKEMVPLSSHVYDIGGPAPNSYSVLVVYKGEQYVTTKVSQYGPKDSVIRKLEKDGLRVNVVRDGITKAEAYNKKEKIQQFFSDKCHLGLTDRERGNKFNKR